MSRKQIPEHRLRDLRDTVLVTPESPSVKYHGWLNVLRHFYPSEVLQVDYSIVQLNMNSARATVKRILKLQPSVTDDDDVERAYNRWYKRTTEITGTTPREVSTEANVKAKVLKRILRDHPYAAIIGRGKEVFEARFQELAVPILQELKKEEEALQEKLRQGETEFQQKLDHIDAQVEQATQDMGEIRSSLEEMSKKDSEQRDKDSEEYYKVSMDAAVNELKLSSKEFRDECIKAVEEERAKWQSKYDETSKQLDVLSDRWDDQEDVLYDLQKTLDALPRTEIFEKNDMRRQLKLMRQEQEKLEATIEDLRSQYKDARTNLARIPLHPYAEETPMFYQLRSLVLSQKQRAMELRREYDKKYPEPLSESTEWIIKEGELHEAEKFVERIKDHKRAMINRFKLDHKVSSQDVQLRIDQIDLELKPLEESRRNERASSSDDRVQLSKNHLKLLEDTLRDVSKSQDDYELLHEHYMYMDPKSVDEFLDKQEAQSFHKDLIVQQLVRKLKDGDRVDLSGLRNDIRKALKNEMIKALTEKLDGLDPSVKIYYEVSDDKGNMRHPAFEVEEFKQIVLNGWKENGFEINFDDDTHYDLTNGDRSYVAPVWTIASFRIIVADNPHALVGSF